MYFHTRFSTNTDPHPTMAQPFRFMAHNGELNTDKKNRLSEAAVASAKRRAIVRPPGQSDSCRLDQTLEARVIEDSVDLVTAVVSMMPPAWENDTTLSPAVRAMFEYFSLYEEKNDGPAALVFGDGTIIGARLDRLGLRPLRTIETHDYVCAFSEAGQIAFAPETVIHRGRVEAGGMLYFDHRDRHTYTAREALEKIAAQPRLPVVAGAIANPDRRHSRRASGESQLPDPLQRHLRDTSALHGVLPGSGKFQIPDGSDAHARSRKGLRHGLRQRHQRIQRPRRRCGTLLFTAIRPGHQPSARQHP